MSEPIDLEPLRAVVGRFRGRRIAVLGDVMVDRYLWGRVDRISPEAPVPVVEIERETASLGGAGNVAANLAALGAQPALVSVRGDDAEGRALVESLAARGGDTGGVLAEAARPRTVQTRIVANSQQVVRAGRAVRGDVDGALLGRLLAALATELGRAEALVVSDYGKGVVHPGTLDAAIGAARRRGIPVCV